jgi:hypothetical protein
VEQSDDENQRQALFFYLSSRPLNRSHADIHNMSKSRLRRMTAPTRCNKQSPSANERMM